MAVVDTQIQIAAPPEAVWAVVMDPQRLADWVTIHRHLGEVSNGAPKPGFRMDQTLHLRGANFKVHWELAECDAGRRAVWHGRGPARSRATTEYIVEPDGAGTRFHYRNEFHPPLGPLGAAASRALIGGISEREATRTLERLKALLEGPNG
jgi:carbon monoxide dehydrogenase subunit G